ncbi:hypothetical protein [Flavobacterium sp. 3HN19-14]|uniref:hypothetical protein n=1 Tax=Flavobacterium sp. 3HN19-14 TaxID=3448133 RepID=UPI003EE26958
MVYQIVLNLVYASMFLKLKVLWSIPCSILISCLSLFIALTLIDHNLYSDARDPYGIMTAIVYNAILPILFWEIIFQIKKYFNNRRLKSDIDNALEESLN